MSKYVCKKSGPLNAKPVFIVLRKKALYINVCQLKIYIEFYIEKKKLTSGKKFIKNTSLALNCLKIYQKAHEELSYQIPLKPEF